MAPQNILAEVRRRPFTPFKMVLAGGATYTVRHPDQCMVQPKNVVVGATAADGVIAYTVNVNPYNVLRIEPATA